MLTGGDLDLRGGADDPAGPSSPEETRCYGLAPHVNWRATHMLEVRMVDRRFLVLPAVS